VVRSSAATIGTRPSSHAGPPDVPSDGGTDDGTADEGTVDDGGTDDGTAAVDTVAVDPGTDVGSLAFGRSVVPQAADITTTPATSNRTVESRIDRLQTMTPPMLDGARFTGYLDRRPRRGIRPVPMVLKPPASHEQRARCIPA
jgi:hypothetical protein